MIAEIVAMSLTLSEERDFIKSAFERCVLVSKDRTDVEMCIKTAAQNAGVEWHCTYAPDGNSKACTNAVWLFEGLWGDLLFKAAQELLKK